MSLLGTQISWRGTGDLWKVTPNRGGPLPTNPGITSQLWSHHVVLRVGGLIADPLLEKVFGSESEFKEALFYGGVQFKLLE